jgi:valyl-tRNA synthetase
MPHDLPKSYDPTAIEDHWAEYWVREKLFDQPAVSENERRAGQSFSILLPPPNVTGRLHMGHMLNQTEMDILTRWHRMKGDRALWLPGTDHAGIATQMMVERQLVTEGTTRQKLGREAFVKRVWEWRCHYGGAILDQMKRLGASVDWDREYFTMDERLSVAVREAFVRLYEQGLIYRGAYIVNWCPRCQTAISDLEVVYDEHKGHLWEIRYPVHDDSGRETGEFLTGVPNDRSSSLGWLTIATTRPETMLGDVAVAIHPEDERYKYLHGKKLVLPLMNREIPIILDEWVSREFGTGAVKVTPAHDPNDFALGERHHLPSINVMDDTAHINENGGKYAGLDRFAARKQIVEELTAQGLLAGVKDHVHNVGHCDRCKTIVEPRLSTQWFIKIQPLADKAIAAVKPDANGKKAIRFTPEMYEKTYLNWMENIHDWCISRQLWWGHRIPAWHCPVCHKITVARQDPTKCAHCGSDQITQETDVLDTWFSSGLLPVSVFGWPNITEENRADFDTFYPTSLLVTGFDILFFWVARMIMLGCWFSADIKMPDGSDRPLSESVPFREVYIHALVRDANREKMSKTKGNVIDPIEIVKQYGTDAVRFTLASMASPGTDIAFNVARTEGYRAFANKIWNAARFIFMNVDKAAEAGITVDRSVLGGMPTLTPGALLEERWIIAELNVAAGSVNQALENYRFDDAASAIYQFFWGSFCDWYLEIVKLRLDFTRNPGSARIRTSLTTLVSVFEAALRLLSPIMPFLSEELWHAVYDDNAPAKSIALSSYPQARVDSLDYAAGFQMEAVQRLIIEVRALRKEIGVDEKLPIPIKLAISAHPSPFDVRVLESRGVTQQQFGIDAADLQQMLELNKAIIQKLGKVSEMVFSSEPLSGPNKRSSLNFDLEIVYERTIDVAAERERLTKDIAKYEKGLASAERQLGNEAFLLKAPPPVVEGLKKQEMETRTLLEKAREALRNLPPG